MKTKFHFRLKPPMDSLDVTLEQLAKLQKEREKNSSNFPDKKHEPKILDVYKPRTLIGFSPLPR